MPVLINTSTGLAENLADQQASQAINAKSHSMPFNDPEGNPVIAPYESSATLLSQGYSQPSVEQLQGMLEHAHYSSTGQEVKTFLEGAASDATFGLSTGLERLAGESPEAIRGRAETNPGVSAAGRITGLGLSLLTGAGEGQILGKAGAKAVALAGLEREAPTALQRIGASTVRQATEMAMLQGGDEVSKMFSQDPGQSAETAIANMGMSALMGGAFGGAGTAALMGLGKVAEKSGAEAWLKAIKDKTIGQASADAASKMAEDSGLTLAPEMRAVLSGEAKAKQMGAELYESGSKAGTKYRQSVDDVKKQASSEIMQAMGRSESDLDRVQGLSKYDSGEKVKQGLVEELQAAYKPVKDAYGGIEEKFSANVLPEGTHNQIGERLGELALEKGYNLSGDSPAMKEINRVLKDLPNLKTFEDLRKYQSVARENAMASGIPQLPRLVSQTLRKAEEDALIHVFEKEAPELISQHKLAREGYKDFMGKVDDLNDRLHVGKYFGPESFINSLKEMSPEDVIRRMGGQGDAGLLKTLQESYPKAAQAIRDFHIDSALKQSSQRMAEGINTKTLFNTMSKWSPELKQFIVSPEAASKIDSIQSLLKELPERINPSGTARALDTLWKKMPGGIMSVLAMLSGHNPIMGYVMGSLGRAVGREAPDALKLSLLKFLGSEAPLSAPAFKTMLETTKAIYNGEKTLNKAASALFKSGSEVVPSSMIPSERQQQILDQHIRAAQINPTPLIDSTGSIGHYMPEHAAAFGTAMGQAAAYLNSVKPDEGKTGMLDTARIPTKTEKAQYQRALEIVEQPLMLLQHVKDGTITPKDLQAVQSVYPGLLRSMQQKALVAMTDHVADEGIVPYKTRMGLSLLLGMPLDSSLTPQNMMANQSINAPEQPPPQMGQPKGSSSAIKKISTLSQTPSQAREANRASRA